MKIFCWVMSPHKGINQLKNQPQSCILKAKAPKIKTVIAKLQELGIEFNVTPSFEIGYDTKSYRKCCGSEEFW